MTRPGTTPAWTWFRVLLAALLVAILPATVPPAGAEDPPEVDVEITSVSAQVVNVSTPDQEVVIEGRMTNTSSQSLRWVGVHFWRSGEAITGMDGLEAALASPSNQPVGARLVEENLGQVQVLAREDAVAPGDTRTFSVRATLSDLGISQDHAVHLVGVHILATPDSGGRHTVGRARTLVSATTDPLESSLLVRLSRKPTLVGTSEFTSDALTRELTDGDLLTLTRAARTTGATVLLDPLLFQEISALTEQHTINGEAAQPVAEADEWLQLIGELDEEDQLRRLPWADPFLPRVHANGGLETILNWSSGHIPRTLRDTPLTADLRSWATQELVEELASSEVTDVFASNTSSGTVGELPVIEVQELDASGIGPVHGDSPLQLRARRIAEQLLSPTPPVYAISTSAELRESRPTVALQRVVQPAQTEGSVTFGGAPTPPEWPAFEASLTAREEESDFIADLTGNDEDAEARFASAATSAMSWNWTEQADAIARLDAAMGEARDPSLVTVSAAEQFVMGSRTNEFPVTINNGMDVDIRVRLSFISEVPQRIRVPGTETVTIPAGDSQTLGIKPVATGNGVVKVRGQLETESGHRFGPVVPIQITATDLGKFGWIIIIISGAVVLGGTAWRIRAVRADRAEQAKESSEHVSQ